MDVDAGLVVMGIIAVLKRAFDQFDRFVEWSLRWMLKHDVEYRVKLWSHLIPLAIGTVAVVWLLFIGNIGPGPPTYDRCGFLNRAYATAADFAEARRLARAISCPWPPSARRPR
jgi:hypothetical protein